MIADLAVALQLIVAMPAGDARLLGDVRAAQARFETVRRSHLLREWSAPPQRCDAHIGRFCYWYDSTESAPSAEPRSIVDARDRLLAFLDSAVARNPSIAWLVGQRTRYLIEARRYDEAIVGARQCAAEAWWCSALEGLALHVATRYAAADSAFARALVSLSPEQRCAWYDLKPVLPSPLAEGMQRTTCTSVAREANGLWALSKPLWSTPGNDLRTEHFARVTMAAVFARTANAFGISWGDDSREMMIRYGWAEWFTRAEPSMYELGPPNVTGHDREPSYSFFPDVPSSYYRLRIDSTSWQLRAPMANSRYAPRHIDRLTALPHQLVRFPRGDSMLIAAAYRIADTALRRDSVTAFLGVLSDTVLLGTRSETRGLGIMVPRDTLVASIELIGASSKHAARARYSVEPLARVGRWSLSDLLVFEASSGVAERDVNAALMRAITEPVPNTMAVGVLWEMEGAEASVPLVLTLGVTPLRLSLARRMATRLHLASTQAPVQLHWSASAPSDHTAQSVILRLPRSARGTYRVQLSATRADGATVSASREIEVVP